MATRRTVRVTSTLTSNWIPQKEAQIDRAVLEMATDIDRGAKVLAPKQTGALANSGRIERKSLGKYSIIFGGLRVPYARRRHFENYKTPSSLKYLQRSGDSVAKSDIRKYLRDK